jgi:hypothetical protein
MELWKEITLATNLGNKIHKIEEGQVSQKDETAKYASYTTLSFPRTLAANIDQPSLSHI